MVVYTFTCPLTTCNHKVMTSGKKDKEEAAKELIETAKQHLKEAHPEIHKTDDEVDQDIRAHMTS